MDLQELLSDYVAEYGRMAERIKKDLVKEVENGEDLGMAINSALWHNGNFANDEQNFLEELFVKAACLGLGMDFDDFDEEMQSKITSAVLDTPWTDDGLTARERLETVLEGIGGIIERSVDAAEMNLSRAGDNANKLLILLLLGSWTLEEYQSISRRIKSSVALAGGNVSLIAPIIEDMRENYADKGKLKEAGKQLIEQIGAMRPMATQHAVESALYQKIAYQLERIARTEASRAWFDGFMARYMPDDDVFGFKWELSPRHPVFDQCDVCANMNVGYGAGVYPKRYVPSIPRHPHCMCRLKPVYRSQVDENAEFRPQDANKYISALTMKEQAALFGYEGLDAYRRDLDWQAHLRGWDGFEESGSRIDVV